MSSDEDFKNFFDSLPGPVIHDPEGNKKIMENAINLDTLLEDTKPSNFIKKIVLYGNLILLPIKAWLHRKYKSEISKNNQNP
jgi:hypothetical protein